MSYSTDIRKTLILTFLAVFAFAAESLSQVKLTEEEWVLPTYKVSPPDKNPMFFKGESYQGASKYIYPYGMNDVIENERKDHAWKALVLENEYIKLCVTPEIGGKLYYATDKTNDYNFLYKNNVVRPSNIGMLGAWVSGGIEWCVIHHHRASTFLDMDYELAENADGSKTIWIGETEPRHRMRWTIGITSYPGKSYFSADIRITNPTPLTHSMLFWANVATHTNKDYQVIFPPSVQFATYHAKNSFTRWPYSTEIYDGQDFTKGADISWWINSVRNNSFFAHDLKEDFMGGYDHGRQTGTVHIGDHNIVKGAKLWEWGSGPRGQATEALLTEKDGPYVEIMVGAYSDNQPDYSWIKPYEVKAWKQYWYPVKDIRGFKYANLNGAVNLEQKEGNNVFLGYYSTQKISRAKVILKNKDKIVFEKLMEISPEITFTGTVKIEGQYKMTDLHTELIDTETNEVLVAYKPVEQKPAGELPEEVKRPESPDRIATVEELYLTGNRILQFYNPTLNAMDYFKEALKRDPNDIRTNIAMGTVQLKNGEYQQARSSFCRAIKRLTKDYTRPSDCEALYLEGLTLKALGLFDEATDTLYRATWDFAWHAAAYLELSKISCIRGDYVKALNEVNESLSTNARNNSALALKAGILRKTGNPAAAFSLLKELAKSDPLDFRTGNELYLSALQAGKKSESEQLINDLNRKMRGSDFNYLELAAAYLNDGMPGEAEDVLLRFSGNDQMISYYLGFISDLKGKKDDAARYFREGSAQSVDYGFPFRLESEKVLLRASEYMPGDARPHYYLGNLLFDKQPDRALKSWEKAVELDPSFAIAWRNLGFGYNQHSKDYQKAINAYEKAISQKSDDPVYYAELDPLYELTNTSIERRARMFDGKNEVVKKRDDAFVRQIIVLNLSGQYGKAVEYLSGAAFHFREGSSRVRDITVDSKLLYGRNLMEQKLYNEALQQFLSAVDSQLEERKEDNRSPQINYFIGTAYEALGNKKEARKYFTRSVQQETRSADYIKYYQGLSYMKLGNKEKATESFDALIAEGENRLKKGAEIDFFAKFGERESESIQQSNAYLLKGLGYKGLGDSKAATENLRKAAELSASNLYATVELK